MVRLRQHLVAAPVRRWYQDLGRQRLPRLPRFSGVIAPRSRHSGTRVRLPVAPFRRPVCGCEDGLYGAGRRSAGGGDTQVEESS
jgi:hypothetical protein